MSIYNYYYMESRNVKQLEYEVQQKQLTLQEIDVELRKELMRKELLNEIYGMDSVDQSESDVQEDMSKSGSSVTNSLRSSMLERQVDEIR